MTHDDDLRIVQLDDVELDLDGVMLYVAGEPVPVTLQEFRILTVLMHAAGRVISREELLNQVWGASRGRGSNTLSVLVSRLRRKLARPDGTSRIRTIRTLGYAFDVPPSRRAALAYMDLPAHASAAAEDGLRLAEANVNAG
jgi:two-component system OmpR family response regulator